MPELSTVTDPNLPEPKGIATAAVGQVYKADGAGGGSWQDEQEAGAKVGWFDYNDDVTGTTPISVPADTWTDLTNDELGVQTTKGFAPAGVTDVWDATVNRFDFSELPVGSLVDLRIEVDVTTTAANQAVQIALEMNTLNAGAFDVPYSLIEVKTAGTKKVASYRGVYIGSEEVRTGGAKFKILTDAAATVRVHGWFCKVVLL